MSMSPYQNAQLHKKYNKSKSPRTNFAKNLEPKSSRSSHRPKGTFVSGPELQLGKEAQIIR